MSSWTRDLTFKSDDLGHDATLMLTFDQNIEGIYRDSFPACWKAIKFGAEGVHPAFLATYFMLTRYLHRV
ncbi:hypothetical protein PAXINDRAFT_22419 [Paxillus involutus ATCC 200175]|uniref:Uncharacterized protein n=1 Tax=Paxillus involutus ATCC 200175 TaxID=664439 RepID=A0A0C9SZ01_PAXIN|nr:hypothetical protein PAXINDRAFT_22419 [Paxillus involutus ATCC 200175]